MHESPALSFKRAQGMPGAWCARSRAWCVVNTRVSHHGHTGNTRHSLRDGFNGFLRALPSDRAFLSLSSARRGTRLRQLDAGVEASGPHDFSVRSDAVRLTTSKRPLRPVLTSVAIARAPLLQDRMGGAMLVIWH